MTISLDLFASRLDHACKDMEEGMVALKRAYDAEVEALGVAIQDADTHERLAATAIFNARVMDMERRLGEALGGDD